MTMSTIESVKSPNSTMAEPLNASSPKSGHEASRQHRWRDEGDILSPDIVGMAVLAKGPRKEDRKVARDLAPEFGNVKQDNKRQYIGGAALSASEAAATATSSMRKASASAKAASVAAESQELSSGIIPKKLMQYLRAKQREMRCPKWVESKKVS